MTLGAGGLAVFFSLSIAGMSFCHGSDWKIDHFCESSKSVEIFTGVEGVMGVGGHQHTSLISHQLSCQCHCLYWVQCLITMTVAGPAAVIELSRQVLETDYQFWSLSHCHTVASLNVYFRRK